MVNFKYFNNSYNIIYNIIPIFAQKNNENKQFLSDGIFRPC